MSVDFTTDEFVDICKKILIHEGYIYELKDNSLQLTDKGKIVLREIEHV